MAETIAPLLDFTLTESRPFIRVNGTAYEIRTAADLSLREFHHMQQLAPQVGAMLLNHDATVDEDKARSKLLDELCRQAIIAPDDLHARLGDVIRMRIFTVFTHLLLPSLPAAGEGLEAETPANGKNSSRGSRGSTARSRGSRKSRSAPSART